MKKFAWWKLLCMVLLFYTLVGGFLFDVPRKDILNETIRNLYFHVTMWFSMLIIFTVSVYNAIRYLKTNNPVYDHYSVEAANTGIVFGVLGLVTGMIWARFTWYIADGGYWSGDPKQNMAAIGILIYLAYFVLRGSLVDEQQKARISAVYNIFAFAALIPLLYILPRLVASLHPGSAENSTFNVQNDVNAAMRVVFYPAIIGWALLGWWIITLRVRLRKVTQTMIDKDYEKEIAGS